MNKRHKKETELLYFGNSRLKYGQQDKILWDNKLNMEYSLVLALVQNFLGRWVSKDHLFTKLVSGLEEFTLEVSLFLKEAHNHNIIFAKECFVISNSEQILGAGTNLGSHILHNTIWMWKYFLSIFLRID